MTENLDLVKLKALLAGKYILMREVDEYIIVGPFFRVSGPILKDVVEIAWERFRG